MKSRCGTRDRMHDSQYVVCISFPLLRGRSFCRVQCAMLITQFYYRRTAWMKWHVATIFEHTHTCRPSHMLFAGCEAVFVNWIHVALAADRVLKSKRIEKSSQEKTEQSTHTHKKSCRNFFLLYINRRIHTEWVWLRNRDRQIEWARDCVALTFPMKLTVHTNMTLCRYS